MYCNVILCRYNILYSIVLHCDLPPLRPPLWGGRVPRFEPRRVILLDKPVCQPPYFDLEGGEVAAAMDGHLLVHEVTQPEGGDHGYSTTSLLNQSITFLLYSVTRKCVIEGNEKWFQSLNKVF